MTAQAFENVNIYVLLFKTRHPKPVETRHQLQGNIVYREQRQKHHFLTSIRAQGEDRRKKIFVILASCARRSER